MRFFWLFFACAMASGYTFAQTNYAYATFADTRIINGQSVEHNSKGQLKYIISHRFGAINSGAYNQFGLDQATMRMGLDYGVHKRLTVGFGRSTFEKTVNLSAKAKLFYQKEGEENFPVSISYYQSTTRRTLNFPDDLPYPESARWAFAHQLLIGRKFSEKLSLQVMPSVLHLNLVELNEDQNTLYSAGFAGRYQVSYAVAIIAEAYYTPLYQNSQLENHSLAIGVDIKTKGHVFQLHLSNTQGMTEKFFISQTGGNWKDGTVYFGFNISRDFQIAGRTY